jgi:membrane associated rhomboid family serine protease
MTDRILLWTSTMALVGFFIAGKGSYLPLGLTVSGAVMGAGIGLLLAITFSNREKRKREPKDSMTRY